METVEVVVVGGGLAGLAAAYTLADAGVEVLVVERGDYSGSKNVTGGRLYLGPVRPYLAGLLEEAPLERQVIKERLTMMAPESAVTVELDSSRFRRRPAHSATVLRATLDQWMAEKAAEKGALVVPRYRVDDLVTVDGRVAGIRSGDDEVGAKVVVAADGALSFIAERAGLRRPHDPHNLAVGVKEVIELPEEAIQERFGVAAGEGATQLFFGSITAGMLGGGFLYTNRASLSLGLVVGIHALMEKRPSVEPHDLMEAFKARPEVAGLIAGGQPVEYSAHAIPEGGRRGIPRLAGDGILVVGDAAGLALNQGVTVRGMDLALVSGVLAGRAILRAREAGDYSLATLGGYEKALRESAVYRDLVTFRHMPQVLSSPRLFEEYPQAACGLLEEIMWTGAEPKERMSRTVGRTLRRLLRPSVLADLWRMRKV
jgi:electron transfer flavoprotein-quinone oxidoreductase